MKALKDLAVHAATHRIRGRSSKRNSLLKPLDIILDALDRCPNPSDDNELELVWTGCKGLILDHVRRVHKGVHEEEVYRYVDLFREQFFEQARYKNVNQILQQERLIRSAYLVYMRQAIAAIIVARGNAKSAGEAIQVMQEAEDKDIDLEEPEPEQVTLS